MSKPNRDELVAAIQILFSKRRDRLNVRQLKAMGFDRDANVEVGDVRNAAAEVYADAIMGLYGTEDDGR